MAAPLVDGQRWAALPGGPVSSGGQEPGAVSLSFRRHWSWIGDGRGSSLLPVSIVVRGALGFRSHCRWTCERKIFKNI
jgi:hypothetical protein